MVTHSTTGDEHILALPADLIRFEQQASSEGFSALAFNIETLTAKIEEAGKLSLIGLVGRLHQKSPASIFDDLQSERWEIIKFEE